MRPSMRIVVALLLIALVTMGGCTKSSGGHASSGNTTPTHTSESSGCNDESGVCSMPEITEEPQTTCGGEGGVCSMPE